MTDTLQEYTVVRGDTLSGIARRHGIRHWQNLYLATGNVDFVQRRPNPHLIYPGDVVRIPPRSAIAPMEARPAVVHRDFPIFWPQATSHTCWRACGFMLYARKYRLSNISNAQSRFASALGEELNGLTGGLPWNRAQEVYVQRLGFRAHNIVSINDINRAIAQNGPAVVSFHDNTSGHAVIIAGYDIIPGNWIIVDPLAGSVTSYDFTSDDGSGDSFLPGSGSWDGLSSIRGFFEGDSIDPRIYTS